MSVVTASENTPLGKRHVFFHRKKSPLSYQLLTIEASTLQLPAVEDKKKKIKREIDQQDDNFEKEQRKTDHEINDMLRRMIELEALEKKVSSLAQTLFFFCLSFSFSLI